MYFIVDNHLLDRELVAVAMSYMDRYMAKHQVKHHHAYHLVAMTSLYMTIKIYRHNGKCAGVSSFATLSKGLFTEHDLLDMEQSILDTLEWRMHPPTPFAYLELLMLFVPRGACNRFSRRALFERIKYLLELSVTVQFFFGKKPSNIAIAAFIEVMEHEDEPNISNEKYRAHFLRCVLSIAGVDCKAGEVVECREAMVAVHKNSWYEIRDMMAAEGKSIGAFPVTSSTRVSVVSP